ncbi:MAG: hypothetical protein F6K11_06590 [Leptolyngbya sp. SIO3F4]|nr:hypothetical protein [Leptolyngbya sp. SIO3F4]
MAKKFVFLSGLLTLLTLGSSSFAMAQLPEAPPAPPASPENSSPTPSSDPVPESSDSEPNFLRPQTACPEDFETLSSLLIRDIPSYTNRILQSTVADISTAYRPAYVIAANNPERTPLNIDSQVYTTEPSRDESLRQLFFTTLERQYSNALEETSINHFHWLFLVPSEDGWQMVFMFSAIEAEGEVQLPARDSSNGSVAQAIKRWLRDCRADAVLVE